MMERFRSILYLDDMRVPTLHGVDLVQNYAEFTEYLDEKGMPDLISFDHDLAREHYPSGPNEAGQEISYSTYREKTGLDCARFIIENGLALRYWPSIRRTCKEGSISSGYCAATVVKARYLD